MKERIDKKKRFENALSWVIIQGDNRTRYTDFEAMRDGKREVREVLRRTGEGYIIEYYNGDKNNPISREIVELND